MWRANPLRNSRGAVTERGVVHLVEEGGGCLLARLGLKLRMALDAEGRSHCREQTGLSRESAYIHQG